MAGSPLSPLGRAGTGRSGHKILSQSGMRVRQQIRGPGGAPAQEQPGRSRPHWLGCGWGMGGTYPAARAGSSRSWGSCRRSGWLSSTSCSTMCSVRPTEATQPRLPCEPHPWQLWSMSLGKPLPPSPRPGHLGASRASLEPDCDSHGFAVPGLGRDGGWSEWVRAAGRGSVAKGRPGGLGGPQGPVCCTQEAPPPPGYLQHVVQQCDPALLGLGLRELQQRAHLEAVSVPGVAAL